MLACGAEGSGGASMCWGGWVVAGGCGARWARQLVWGAGSCGRRQGTVGGYWALWGPRSTGGGGGLPGPGCKRCAARPTTIVVDVTAAGDSLPGRPGCGVEGRGQQQQQQGTGGRGRRRGAGGAACGMCMGRGASLSACMHMSAFTSDTNFGTMSRPPTPPRYKLPARPAEPHSFSLLPHPGSDGSSPYTPFGLQHAFFDTSPLNAEPVEEAKVNVAGHVGVRRAAVAGGHRRAAWQRLGGWRVSGW